MQATRQSDPERWVKAIRYEDRWSLADERIVSPIRFIARDAVLALCLGRESPRRFSFDGIKEVRLMTAHEAEMPSPVQRPLEEVRRASSPSAKARAVRPR